jgi:hypothetical protein
VPSTSTIGRLVRNPRACRPPQALGHAGIFDLGDLAAVVTDQELARMRVVRVCAADVGMQALELVHQALLEQESPTRDRPSAARDS